MHFLNPIYFYYCCNHEFSSEKIIDFILLWKYLDHIFDHIIWFFPCLAFSKLSTVFHILNLHAQYHIVFYLLNWIVLTFYIHCVLHFFMMHCCFIVCTKYYSLKDYFFKSLSLMIAWPSTFPEGIYFKWLELILRNLHVFQLSD
jgi:hypothetical protein